MAPTHKRISLKNQRKKSCWSEYLSRKLSGRPKDVTLSALAKEASDEWREMGEEERAAYTPDNTPPTAEEEVEALRGTLIKTARALMERGVGVTGVVLDKHQSVVTFGMPGLVDKAMIDMVRTQGAPSGGEYVPIEASGRKYEDRLHHLREDVRQGLNALWRDQKPGTGGGTTFSYKLLAEGGVTVEGGSPNLRKGLKSCGRTELEGLRERLRHGEVSLQFRSPLPLPNHSNLASHQPPRVDSPPPPTEVKTEPGHLLAHPDAAPSPAPGHLLAYPDATLSPALVKLEPPDETFHR